MQNNPIIDEKEFFRSIETIQKQWREFDIQRSYWMQEKLIFQKRIEKLLKENKKHKEVETILIKRIKMLQYSLLQCNVKDNNHQELKDMKDISIEINEELNNNKSANTNPPITSNKRQFLRGVLEEFGIDPTSLWENLKNISHGTSFKQENLKNLDNKDMGVDIGLNVDIDEPYLQTPPINNNNSINHNPSFNSTNQSMSRDNKVDIENGEEENNKTIISSNSENVKIGVNENDPSKKEEKKEEKKDSLNNNSPTFLNSRDENNFISKKGFEKLLSPKKKTKKKTNLKQQLSLYNSTSNNNDNNSNNSDDNKSPLSSPISSPLSKPLHLNNDNNNKNINNDNININNNINNNVNNNVNNNINNNINNKKYSGESDENNENSNNSKNNNSNSNSNNSNSNSKESIYNEEKSELGELDSLQDIVKYGEKMNESGQKLNPKETLRGHLDAVRAISHHPTKPYLLSASDDFTIKLWDLHFLLSHKLSLPSSSSSSSSSSSKKSKKIENIKPLLSFRSSSPILSLSFSPDGLSWYTGDKEGEIVGWKLKEPYENMGKMTNYAKIGNLNFFKSLSLSFHQDSVWSILSLPLSSIFLSLSSDNTICCWDSSDNKLKEKIIMENRKPCCMDSIFKNKLIVGYYDSLVLHDIETNKPIFDYKLKDDHSSNPVVSCVKGNEEMNLIVIGQNDKFVKMFDSRSGKETTSFVAHTDSVSSLDINPLERTQLVTTSHDGTMRLWDINKKSCLQDLSLHRKKWDESIYSVKFHPSFGYLSTCSSDSTIKLL